MGFYAQLNEIEGAKGPDRFLPHLLGHEASARVLQIMSEQEIPFFRFAMNASLAHKRDFDSMPLTGAQLAHHRTLALESIKRQKDIEAADTVDFATFLQDYLRL